jgi:DNA-directed RNA polymerase subunit E'/Rpb7
MGFSCSLWSSRSAGDCGCLVRGLELDEEEEEELEFSAYFRYFNIKFDLLLFAHFSSNLICYFLLISHQI